jgi:hypothetical protein
MVWSGAAPVAVLIEVLERATELGGGESILDG